jgi:hypothetical protein
MSLKFDWIAFDGDSKEDGNISGDECQHDGRLDDVDEFEADEGE